MTISQSITTRCRAVLRARRRHRLDGRADAAGAGEAWTAIGAAMVVMLCCLGPLLVAGGVLGALGGLLSGSWIIAVTAVLLLVGAVFWIRTIRGRASRRRVEPTQRGRG